MKNSQEKILSKELLLQSQLNKCYIDSENFYNEVTYLIDHTNLYGEKQKAEWFREMFLFYMWNLIPSLEETITMDQKHSDLMIYNPDPVFKPFKVEVRQHKKLIHQFLNRFSQVKNDFQIFIEQQNKQQLRRA